MSLERSLTESYAFSSTRRAIDGLSVDAANFALFVTGDSLATEGIGELRMEGGMTSWLFADMLSGSWTWYTMIIGAMDKQTFPEFRQCP